MTNEMIIMNARLALLDAGLIGTTGMQFELIFTGSARCLTHRAPCCRIRLNVSSPTCVENANEPPGRG